MDDVTQLLCLPGQDTYEVPRATNMAVSGNTHPQEWFYDWATGGQSDSGVKVNGYTALSHCPLWQGVNIIAGDVGQVPVRLVRNEFDEQRQHPSWRLLRLRPNALQTPSVWKETMIQWALIWGNGVSWVVRQGARPVELIPLRPDCLWPELVNFEGAAFVVYRYFSPTTGRQFIFQNDDVVHIQGLTSDGLWGYPLFEVARSCIGQGLAIEKHGNSTFRNAARLSGVLKMSKRMDPEAHKRLRSDWERLHSGTDNAGRVAILEEGMEFQQVSMSNLDAQWAEAKEMSGIDAARLLNLPAYKLNYLKDSSVRANLEEQNADYLQRTLSRWFNRCSEEFRRKLLTTEQWTSDEWEYVWDVHEFLQADVDTMSQVVDRLVKAEIMNRNEGRRKFRLPPYPGGERFGSPAINPVDADGNPVEGGGSGGGRGGKKDRDLVEAIQKIYLGVGTVLSAEEAREILNEHHGADLGTLPEGMGPAAQSQLPAPGSDREGSESDEANSPQARMQAAHRDLLLDRVSHLIECETTRVRRAAKNCKNFVTWLDDFYVGNGKPSRIMGLFDSVCSKSLTVAGHAGLACDHIPQVIEKYAEKRHETLLEACSRVTAGDLSQEIEQHIAQDPEEVASALLVTRLEE